MLNSKGLNITDEKIEKWQNSLSYKWTRWFQYTWVGSRWYAIKGGIPSLFKWIKIAWYDRDYDYRYIYTTLRFKLENTANLIERNGISVGYMEDVKWLRITANLIKNLEDDYYNLESYDYQKSDIVFNETDDGMYEMDVNRTEDNLDEYIKKYPLWHKRAIEHIKANQWRYVKDHTDRDLQVQIIGKLRHDKARKLVFKIMEDKIEGWWD